MKFSGFPLGVVLSALLFVFPRAGLAQDSAQRPAYTSADRSFTFTYPARWNLEAAGSKIRIVAPDGARYLLERDTLGAAQAGEAANNSALRDAAEKLAATLLKAPGYAGVKLATVDAGSGAIYRFRGTGAKGDADLVEIWIGIVGRHTVVMAPESAPEPDHSYELSTLFRTISFADTPARAGGAAGRPGATAGNRQAPIRPGVPEGALTAGSRQVSASSATSATPQPPRELERYEGHLISGDVSFVLHVNHGGTAAAEWSRTVGRTQKYTGTFTGEDGNYAVSLRESGSDSASPPALTLTLHSLGGMVGGQYALGPAATKREIAEIKLTAVDVGDVKLRGTKAGASRNGANTRTGMNGANRIGRMGRGRRRP